jgi:CO dehydrogenase/acetyl-CoA synthase delta subunit
MQTYWIIDADNDVVEAWERGETEWTGRHLRGSEQLTVTCLDLILCVADLFR